MPSALLSEPCKFAFWAPALFGAFSHMHLLPEVLSRAATWWKAPGIRGPEKHGFIWRFICNFGSCQGKTVINPSCPRPLFSLLFQFSSISVRPQSGLSSNTVSTQSEHSLNLVWCNALGLLTKPSVGHGETLGPTPIRPIDV